MTHILLCTLGRNYLDKWNVIFFIRESYNLIILLKYFDVFMFSEIRKGDWCFNKYKPIFIFISNVMFFFFLLWLSSTFSVFFCFFFVFVFLFLLPEMDSLLL